MKNFILSLTAGAFFAIIFSSCNSCNNRSSDAPATNPPKTENGNAQIAVDSSAKALHTKVTIQSPNPNTMEEISISNTNMDDYVKDNSKSTNVYSFIFNVDADFKSYFLNAEAQGAKLIHFALAGKHANLKLYISSVDGAGNHIYMQSNSDQKYYAFKNNATANYSVPKTTSPATPANSIGGDISRYYLDTLNIDTAVRWISVYKSKSHKNETANSFLMADSIFYSYISNAAGPITKLKIYMADNSNRITLVITGLDANGKEVFIDNGAKRFYILEYCNPCPQCNAVNNYGRQFEDGNSKKMDYKLELHDMRFLKD